MQKNQQAQAASASAPAADQAATLQALLAQAQAAGFDTAPLMAMAAKVTEPTHHVGQGFADQQMQAVSNLVNASIDMRMPMIIKAAEDAAKSEIVKVADRRAKLSKSGEVLGIARDVSLIAFCGGAAIAAGVGYMRTRDGNQGGNAGGEMDGRSTPGGNNPEGRNGAR